MNELIARKYINTKALATGQMMPSMAIKW